MCAKTRSSFSSDQSVDDQLLSHWFVRIIYSREDKQELNDFLNIWLYFYIFFTTAILELMEFIIYGNYKYGKIEY